jgi:hypothetical protein
MSFDAVLFDFSDTLFWRNGSDRLAVLLANQGVDLDVGALASVWDQVKRESIRGMACEGFEVLSAS